MKNNMKVIFGTMTGIMIGGLAVVGANQAIQAIQNDQIKVSLNGEIQTFTDEKTGEAQFPITYHDRTYLPLRNIAQLTGVNVDYDNNTNTALLESQNKYTEYRGDNVEGKYFWDYSLLNKEKDKYYLVLSDKDEIIKEETRNNMAASLLKRYSQIPNIYPPFVISEIANQLERAGDGAGWYAEESNYNLSDFYNLLKYEKPIEYKFAAVHGYVHQLIPEFINNEEIVRYGYTNSNGEIIDEERLRKEMNDDAELKRLLDEVDEIGNYSLELEAYVTAKYTEDFQMFPPKPRFKNYYVDSITFMNGNNTTIDNYYDNARAKKVKITMNKDEYIITLDDTPEFQNIYLGWYTDEYTKPVNVKIEVLEKYSGRKSEDVYFSGISIQGRDNFVSFAM